MPMFLYCYVELFSYIGVTPEDPGGDFGIAFWIDAPNRESARTWGKEALADYVRLRYRFATHPPDPNHFEGWIDEDAKWTGQLDIDTPICKVGQFPKWKDPWKEFPEASNDA